MSYDHVGQIDLFGRPSPLREPMTEQFQMVRVPVAGQPVKEFENQSR